MPSARFAQKQGQFGIAPPRLVVRRIRLDDLVPRRPDLVGTSLSHPYHANRRLHQLVVRIKCQGLLVLLQRVVYAAQVAEDIAKVVMRPHVVGIELERLLEVGDRLVPLLLRLIR